MAKRALTRDLYDALCEGFRQSPGNAMFAAKLAGCDRRMAKRGWEKGWAHTYTWAISIKTLLEREKEHVRARRAAFDKDRRTDDRKRRELAQKDAIETQAQEAIAVKATRGNAIGLNTVVAKLLQACIPLAERMKTTMESTTFSPAQATKIFASVAYITRHASEAAKNALQLERMRVGDPNKTPSSEADDLPISEIAAELAGVAATVERAKMLGWKVHPGGKVAPDDLEDTEDMESDENSPDVDEPDPDDDLTDVDEGDLDQTASTS